MLRALQKRSGLLGCVGLLVMLVACLAITTFAVDRVCYEGLSRRLPIYPGAEIVFRTHNLFNEFGMGNTVITLYSPDPPDVVRAWYARESGAYLREALQSSDPIIQASRRIAQGDWSVAPAEDGVGSQIILFGTCVN